MTENAVAARREAALRRAVTAGGVAVLLAQLGLLITRSSRGDFALHAAFARRLVAGTFLYEGGLDIPYPPAFALAYLPFTPLPDHLGHVLAYPLGVAALVLLVANVERALGNEAPSLWTRAATLALASRFVLRDLYDGGANLWLAALVWLGVGLWQRGRDAPAGAAIGLAAALKLTPVLFIAYFAWKRQGRLVAAAAATFVAVSLVPALWLSPGGLVRHLAVWAANVGHGLSGADASIGVLGPEKVTNIALRPAVARLLTGSPIAVEDATGASAGFRGLGLSPAAAAAAATLAIAAAVLATAIACRRPLTSRDDARLSREAAGVAVLALLVSPITWRAHAVAAIPALYLLVRGGAPAGPARRLFLGVWVVLVLLLNEAVAGRDLTRLLSATGVFTALLVWLLVLSLRPDPAGAA